MTVADFLLSAMKFRLGRLDRFFTSEYFYFLTFCTHDRQKLLAKPAVHEGFRLFCTTALDREIYVGRYVIMPDHIHLFAAFDDRHDVSMWMKSLKNSLSKTLRNNGAEAPHWQKGFFDHLMRSEESYGEKWDYVFQNPVRHNLVADPSLWPYQGEITPISYH